MSISAPITFNQLYDKIVLFEKEVTGELNSFWELIKIRPEKWLEPVYEKDGDGFWVVAICGKRIIWYNDFEDGFSASKYKEYKLLDEYGESRGELKSAVETLYDLIHKQ